MNCSSNGDGLVNVREKPNHGGTRPDSRVLEKMDVFKPLEGEILLQLAKGMRTASELTETIYGVRRPNPNYFTYYMKVSRAVKALQRRGYATTRLFGRDKPYRLTPHAAAKMMDIEAGGERLVTPLDALTYATTAILGPVNIAMADVDWLTTPWTIALYTAFTFLAGYSLRLLWTAIKKVS